MTIHHRPPEKPLGKGGNTIHLIGLMACTAGRAQVDQENQADRG
jgi:hypothetical protein